VGLTWRDLVSSAAVMAIIVTWGVLDLGKSLPLLSSAWAVSPVLMVLAAICAVSAAGDLHTRPQPRLGVIFRRTTTVLGTVALVAGMAGLIADSGHALEFLVVATILLYTTGTIWHVLSMGSEQ
jgi:hypothetical protein